MNINVQKELEVLLNEAAEVYDAPGMDQVAEHLAKNNVVVLPCGIGDKLYAIYDGTDEDVRDVARVEELTVTEIGTSRIFCSSYVPPGDDISFEIPIRELGVKYFFVREDAEQMLKGGGE